MATPKVVPLPWRERVRRRLLTRQPLPAQWAPGNAEFTYREKVLPILGPGESGGGPATPDAGAAEPPRKRPQFDDRGYLQTAEGQINLTAYPFITTADSQLALKLNQSRKYLLIQNNGADFFVVNFGNAATLTNGLKMPSNSVYEMLRPTIQDVYIIGNSAGLNVILLEGT
jgi:hypothetical protein